MQQREIRILDRTFHIEHGEVARLAHGAVLVRENETVVLVAVVAAPSPRPEVDFFPLTVEYRERFSAVGRFPGGYRKREGAASNQEILTSRLIDRSIRPLFPEGFRSETQVMATVLAFDPDGDPAVLGILGASAALQLSDIPWDGPAAALRVGRSPEGAWIANPTASERAASSVDLIVSVCPEGLVMVEGELSETPEAETIEALEFARRKLEPLLTELSALRAEGSPKRPLESMPADADAAGADLRRALDASAGAEIRRAFATADKQERRLIIHTARENALAQLGGEAAEPANEGRGAARAAVERAFEDLTARLFRAAILENGRRIDGRGPTDIRPISCKVGWLPRVHGSALFTRGETQALAVCTLGTGQDEQEVEGIEGTHSETFQLYYRFPPYSVGEVRPIRGPGRREIGHGNLARRALDRILPSAEVFPYTIKIESEITASNGSSSMASVCGGCLALMDAGVPILGPVAGIAMGLVREGDRSVVLSDIMGDEDHLGDMDFKVAGTRRGITALQLDNKIGGLPFEVLGSALDQARRGRLRILDEMLRTLPKPRPQLSPHAPRVGRLRIGVHRIRDLIGAGGRVIQALQADTGTKVDVEDDGTVRVYAPSGAALDYALKRIHNLTDEPEVGRFYRGTVTGVKDFGVFVRIFEGIEGLVHVTELAEGPVRDPGQVASPGDEVVVKVLGVDGQGKIRLSRKQAMHVPESEIANA